MKKIVLLILVCIATIACSSSKSAIKETSKNQAQILVNEYMFLVTEISTDGSYGYSPKNAVEVGGVSENEGPMNERRYLNALTGPNGETVSYYRAGSCCPVKSENGIMGHAMLDNYRVTWEGSKDTVSIYINMYDSSKLKAPKGFGLRK